MTTLKAPRKTGHWLRNDVPHSGWRCEGIKDEGQICEMCEVTDIGHSHVMVHEKLPGVWLMCGYVCAAYMTGNAEQERLREALYKWRCEHRRQLTPIEKLRRKSWRGEHYTSGAHEWDFWPKGQVGSPFFTVRVEDREGWRYSVKRPWWDQSCSIQSEPFASDVKAALAGIERAELLLADPQWMEADAEGLAAYHAAWKAKDEERELRSAVSRMNEYGFPDLAAALEQRNITISEAFHEMRARQKAEEAARETTVTD